MIHQFIFFVHLSHNKSPYLPEIFDPIDVRATKRFICVAKEMGFEVHSFGRKLPFDSNVIQHVNVQTEDLIELYSSSILTFTPQPVELFGLVPLESMFCGTPVISTFYHEALNFHKNGVVFNFNKIKQMIEKVSVFKPNEVISSVEKFSLEHSSRYLLSVLNDLNY